MLYKKANKKNIFDPYSVFLAIATNIPQRLKTGFVFQGHKCPGSSKLYHCSGWVFLLHGPQHVQ